MLSLEPNTLLELPIDELAMLVLKDLLDNREWSEYNYYLLYQNNEPYQSHHTVPHAVAEAIAWLKVQGMVATTPGKDGGSLPIFVTRWGHEALKKDLSEIRSIRKIQQDLHPLILNRVRRQFLLGEYENAVFVAMKAVEVRVRKLGGFGDDMVGVDLMTQAFRKDGPLADTSAPAGEVDGTMMLFRGAYAVLRNPSGHREVTFENVTEAAEAVATASLLMRILDKVEKRLGKSA